MIDYDLIGFIIQTLFGILIIIFLCSFYLGSEFYYYLKKKRPDILKKFDIFEGPFGFPISNTISNFQLLFSKIGNEDKKIHNSRIMLRVFLLIELLFFISMTIIFIILKNSS